MKLHNIAYSTVITALIFFMTACEGEKDLIIIDGTLPIKTESLYMVGDATPTGWDIDSPTPLTSSEEDPLVYVWEGSLNVGEIKLCTSTGSWDVAFIRPMTNGEEIGRTDISDAPFQMYAGDPDNKWYVTEAGTYKLTFDLRNWTMSSLFLSAAPEADKTPIMTETLYIVGDAVPCGWDIDSPILLDKTADYVFEYDGALTAGEIKLCTSTGSWDVNFIRPATNGVEISRSGVENSEFVYSAGPDNKWVVVDEGMYHLTFNLEEYTFEAEYEGEIPSDENDKEPIESETLFIIGDATPNGWSMDYATALSKSADSEYIFTWEGMLTEGYMKACLVQDGTFSCPFIRPSSADVEISEAGVARADFVYTKSPDDLWLVTKAGIYSITFDLENWTIEAKYLE